MTSKSEGCEAFAKLLHNLLLRRSPSKAAILHTCTHAHIAGSTPFLAFFFGLTFEKNNSSKTPAETHSRHTHTRYPKNSFDIVQLESFFFLPAAPAFFLCFDLTRFSFPCAHHYDVERNLKKKKRVSFFFD